MSDSLNHKLSEAIPESMKNAAPPVLNDMPGQRAPEAAPGQQHEAQESQEAHNAQGDRKDRLVDIGKANHMGGHSTGRRSDS